ncbi:Uncharacterized protein APZ42_022630 [Daphnia magna]|uniref:AMP-binding enzyme C-terminal domain-containing protein n=1 Tax=Daphnia magna TaxID=35525 RepID=A0A164VND9_9CRUS|nr:Uncharacterized protein APZ42_022630 [Daphnia magna]
MKGYLNQLKVRHTFLTQQIERKYLIANLPQEWHTNVWFNTGDQGYYDAENNLFVIGRYKELIKYKSRKVAPSNIETQLMTHSAVKDVAVVGLPHDIDGEHPLAYVVIKMDDQGHPLVTAKELIDFTNERVVDEEQLRGGVRFIERIPRNKFGKVVRHQLVANLHCEDASSRYDVFFKLCNVNRNHSVGYKQRVVVVRRDCGYLNWLVIFCSIEMAFMKLLYLSAIDFGIQWILWGLASWLKTEKFYDLAGSSTFALIAFLAYNKYSTGHIRTKIQTTAILLWAVRLGFYLFSRVLKEGHDRRFKDAKEDPSVFFVYWTLQGVWVIVTLLPSLLMVMQRRQPPLSALDWLGWLMWLVGFITEVVADYQKSQFRSNPANAGKFINTGLWSISRHPNYFGEILLWCGLFTSASSTFTNWWEYLTILSPMFLTYLITQMSGVPPLEKYGLQKWGLLPEYRAYLKNTPVLVPYL